MSTTSTAPILKTVTLTAQQMQAMNAARGLTGAALRDPAALKTGGTNPTATLRMVSHLDQILAKGEMAECFREPFFTENTCMICKEIQS
jgi:hypothetical protein